MNTSYLSRFLIFLKNRPIIHLFILLTYYLLVVLPHEWVGLLTVDIFGGLPRDTYNLIILIAGIIGLCLYFIPVIRQSWKQESRSLIFFYLVATIILAGLCINYLFVINIEMVHFIQYAVFAILCFPLLQNYNLTLIWATLAGALDEAYQYFYLAPERTDYYDFNDVITNLIGAAFGLILLRAYQIPSIKLSILQFLKSKTFFLLLACTIIILFLLTTPYLSLYQGKKEALFYIVKVRPEGFWSVVHPNVTFHIMLPLEGILTTIALWLFYSRLGNGIKKDTTLL